VSFYFLYEEWRGARCDGGDGFNSATRRLLTAQRFMHSI